MQRQRQHRSVDAVVVVPGIMGSELVDGRGKVRWGLSPSVLARAWLSRRVGELEVTDDDLAGGGRLRATRLLRVPAFMPILGGIEPYSALLSRARDIVVDEAAVLEFPYDWRLSIEFNAHRLVAACEGHLAAWRRKVTQERFGDPADVRLVIVAHSMGGLVARYASEVLGLSAEIRQITTLGTPYFGSVRAVQMLASGEGAPVPRAAAKRLALNCPGVYDLLPRYLCVDSGDDLRALTTSDVTAIGGSAHLAGEAAVRWERLGLGESSPARTPVNALVGAEQPTLQSVRFDAGVCTFFESLAGVDFGGDSTVYRQSASPGGAAMPLPQKHGALAKTAEALTFVADKLLGNDARPPLGTLPIGADIPDLAVAGTPLTVTVTGTAGDPVGVSVMSTNLETFVPVRWPDGRPLDGTVRFSYGLEPGLHRVEVKAGGFSAISDIVFVEAQP